MPAAAAVVARGERKAVAAVRTPAQTEHALAGAAVALVAMLGASVLQSPVGHLPTN